MINISSARKANQKLQQEQAHIMKETNDDDDGTEQQISVWTNSLTREICLAPLPFQSDFLLLFIWRFLMWLHKADFTRTKDEMKFAKKFIIYILL